MSANSPIIGNIAENYDKLMPVVSRLYQHMDGVAQLAILPLFLLSVVMAFSKDLGVQGAVILRLKRLVLTMLLLAAFPSLTGLIKNIGQEVALSIDNLNGIDAFLKAAGERAKDYSVSVKSLFDFGNDLIISALVAVSYVFLYVARYLLVAFYHFYWMILVVTGPLLILGNLFDSTSVLAKNLFKSLIQVACWPIVWALLSAFLKALPFQDAYAIDGGYTAIVVMNFILALALLFSPFMLGKFCEGSIVGTGSGIVSSGVRALQGLALPMVGAAAIRAGEKLHPHAKKLLPNRDSVGALLRRNSGMKSLVFAVLVSVSSMAAASDSVRVINVRVGLSSVVCFDTPPESIAIGDGRVFRAQKLGRNLLLQSTAKMKESNLLIFSNGQLDTSFRLTSDPILPHTERVNCDKQKSTNKTVSRKKLVKRERIFSRAENNGLRAELLRKAWESPKKDYFTLRLRLVNNSQREWMPSWSKIVLEQGDESYTHTGLSAERKAIQVGASVIFDVQFTRPEVSVNRGHLLIPSQQGDIRILVEKGASKK